MKLIKLVNKRRFNKLTKQYYDDLRYCKVNNNLFTPKQLYLVYKDDSDNDVYNSYCIISNVRAEQWIPNYIIDKVIDVKQPKQYLIKLLKKNKWKYEILSNNTIYFINCNEEEYIKTDAEAEEVITTLV